MRAQWQRTLSLWVVCGISLSGFSLTAQASIDRFSLVSPGIYRGGQPSEEADYAMLRDQGIHTILNLRGGQVVADEIEIASRYGLSVVNVEMKAYEIPSKNTVARAHDLLIDPASQPVFVHCQRGRDRTGLVVGLHRVLDQGWSREDAWAEMKVFGFTDEFLGLSYAFFRDTGNDAMAWIYAFEHLLNPRN